MTAITQIKLFISGKNNFFGEKGKARNDRYEQQFK